MADRFNLEHSVSSLSRFLAALWLGYLDLYRRIFGYLIKYPKRRYAINPHPLTINADYDRFQMKYDFVNQYAYSSEDIGGEFPETLLGELEIHVFVIAYHRNDKVAGRSINGGFSVVGSIATTWSSKCQTAVQTSTFGAEFTEMKKSVKESVMLWYHLIKMGIKVPKPTPIFMDSMSVVLNATNPGITLNNRIVVLSYHFVK